MEKEVVGGRPPLYSTRRGKVWPVTEQLVYFSDTSEYCLSRAIELGLVAIGQIALLDPVPLSDYAHQHLQKVMDEYGKRAEKGK